MSAAPQPGAAEACPCGRHGARTRPLAYAQCCGPAHTGEQPAADAETLMRSRYSSFVRGDVPYLLATWHASTRPPTLELEPGARWLGLEVRAHQRLDEDHAEVEFVARWRVAGCAVRQHERSRFVREAGQWLYVDGDVR